MNFKTTALLAAALIVAGAAWFVSRWKSSSRPVAAVETSIPKPPGSKPLITTELGDITQVIVERAGGETWTFEKAPAREDSEARRWVMTAPHQFNAIGGDVLKLTSQLRDVQYEIAYKPGEAGGVSASTAGLEPPIATITLTGEKGRPVSVELGRPASEMTTYLRLKGSNEIVVAKYSSKGLLKNSAAEWRDGMAWTFAPDNARKLEITDRTDPAEPKSYTLARVDEKWVFESPIAAKTSPKVDDMVRMLSRLRLQQWTEGGKDKLAGVGLDPAPLVLRVTVEDPAPESDTLDEPSADNESKPKAEPKITTYELHVSDRSPLGEETKAYVRIGEETMYGTLMKATADKFKPSLTEWRDLRVTTAAVLAATRIEIKTKDGAIALGMRDGGWFVEGGDVRADEPAVKELLKSLSDLKAVAFVDATENDWATFGLSAPQVEIKLTAPGVDEPERIAVGSPTDAENKLLTWVRHGESMNAAKVRTPDVANLVRAPFHYYDRTITDLRTGQITALAVDMANPVAEGRISATFTSADGAWSMTTPVAAPANAERINKLVDALKWMRGTGVAGKADAASSFGLSEPAVRLTITYQPPAGNGTEAESTETPPQAQSIDLAAVEHGGDYYLLRKDRPYVYEITHEQYSGLLAELRSGTPLTFDEPKVREFSVRIGKATHAFVRQDGKWRYKSEPDLPLDSKKVTNLLLQLKDLKTDRFASHGDAAPGVFGLDAPEREVQVVTEDGSSHVLRISARASERDPGRGTFASSTQAQGVFLLAPDQVSRVAVDLKTLE